MMKYLTRPATPKEKDNTEVIVNNGKIQTKNEFIKSLPLEEQPGFSLIAYSYSRFS